MNRISLTDFVDIVSRAGVQKFNKVVQIKARAPYSPSVDFYKRLREQIVRVHAEGLAKSELKAVLRQISNETKLKHFPDVLSGYEKWWGRKQLEWFVPPHRLITSHGVELAVNPELGLVVNGEPHVIKLYFKGEPLSKHKVSLAAALMQNVLEHPIEGGRFSVLDARAGKLFTPSGPVKGMDAMLDIELQYIGSAWATA